MQFRFEQHSFGSTFCCAFVCDHSNICCRVQNGCYLPRRIGDVEIHDGDDSQFSVRNASRSANIDSDTAADGEQRFFVKEHTCLRDFVKPIILLVLGQQKIPQFLAWFNAIAGIDEVHISVRSQ